MNRETIEGADLLTVVLKELEFVQGEIARFDTNGLTVKSWSVVTWSGLMAFSLEKDAAAVALIASVSVIAFAYLELVYRRFQARLIKRAAEIESILSSRSLGAYEYRLGRSVLAGDAGELLKCLRLPHYSIFYGILVLIAIVLALLL